MSSGDSKGLRWGGEEDNYVNQLLYLDLEDHMDDERAYDIYIGKGGPDCAFYHHYIVVESPDLPIRSRRLIFELAKTTDAMGRKKVVPNIRQFSRDGNPDYKITVTTTLRKLAELASRVLYYLGSYNLITASCQTFSDEFLKQLGSCGYNTYVKTAITAGVVAGIVGVAAGITCWLTKDKNKK